MACPKLGSKNRPYCHQPPRLCSAPVDSTSCTLRIVRGENCIYIKHGETSFCYDSETIECNNRVHSTYIVLGITNNLEVIEVDGRTASVVWKHCTISHGGLSILGFWFHRGPGTNPYLDT